MITIIVLALLGGIGALLLFFVSKKFEVKEDPRIGEVNEVLPQANCGGCGFPGCSAFASACVKGDRRRAGRPIAKTTDSTSGISLLGL